jgi:hypothetical protein
MFRFALCFLLCILPSAAMAADIDFTQILKGPNGDTLMQVGKDGKTPEPATLGDTAGVALEAVTDEDRNVDGKVKFDRDMLARKIYGNAHAALSAEEIALIKQRIGKVYGPAQVGAAWPLLDPTLSK